MIVVKTLPNGLRFVFCEWSSDNCCYSIFANGGILYENKHNVGITHFLEHLFLSGFDREKINLQKYYDFTTTDEYLNLSFTFPSSQFEYFQNNIRVAIASPQFSERDSEHERQIILNEFFSYENDSLYTLFPKSILGFSPLGTKKNVKQFSQEELVSWHHTIFSPQNMVIGIAGTKDFLKKTEEELLSSYSLFSEKKKSPQQTEREHIENGMLSIQNANQKEITVYCCFHFSVESYWFAHLAYLLVSEQYFFQAERNQIYNCNLRKHEYNTHFQIWYFEFTQSYSYAKKVLASLLDFLRDIHETITLHELQKAKEDFLFELESHEQSIHWKLDFLCTNILKGREYKTDILKALIEKISLADMKEFLQKHIKTNEFNFFLVGDLDQKKGDSFTKIIQAKCGKT